MIGARSVGQKLVIMELNSGVKLGQYTLIKKFAGGHFSEIWLAERRTFFKRVFVLRVAKNEEPDLRRFRREMRLWSEIGGHPNILSIVDADVAENIPFTVSEYIEEGTLYDLLKKTGSLEINLARRMIREVLDGLEFLHDKGIIHRDLKPQNIFLNWKRPLIGDFGVSAKLEELRESEKFTRSARDFFDNATTYESTRRGGTPLYMAPDAAEGMVSFQNDLWAVGVIFFEMVAGFRPFESDTLHGLFEKIVNEKPRPLPADVPKPIQKFIFRCLEKDLQKRFQSVSQMQKVLAELSIEGYSKDSVTAIFTGFPKEIRIPCEQYLLYFAQFLRDMGVNATSNLTHDAGRVLFSVTPAENVDALDKIRKALSIYLYLPESPIAYDESFEAMRLQQQIETLQHSQRMAARELRFTEKLLIAQSETIQEKNVIISQKDSTIEQQNRILERIISRSVMMDSLENKDEFETILDGLGVGESKWLREKVGIRINPVTSLKSLASKLMGNDYDLISLDLDNEGEGE